MSGRTASDRDRTLDEHVVGEDVRAERDELRPRGERAAIVLEPPHARDRIGELFVTVDAVINAAGTNVPARSSETTMRVFMMSLNSRGSGPHGDAK